MLAKIQGNEHFHTLMTYVKFPQYLENKQGVADEIKMHVPFDPKIFH